MNRKDILLAIIGSAQDDGDFGRTSLQKLSYFVGEATGRRFGHRAYHYGPYSDEIEEDVALLTMGGEVIEHIRVLGHGRHGPVRLYHYALSQAGRERLEQLRTQESAGLKSIEEVVKKVRQTAGSLHQDLLSQAGKTHFVAEGLDQAPDDKLLDDLAHAHGWSLKDKDREKVKHLVGMVVPDSPL